MFREKFLNGEDMDEYGKLLFLPPNHQLQERQFAELLGIIPFTNDRGRAAPTLIDQSRHFLRQHVELRVQNFAHHRNAVLKHKLDPRLMWNYRALWSRIDYPLSQTQITGPTCGKWAFNHQKTQEQLLFAQRMERWARTYNRGEYYPRW